LILYLALNLNFINRYGFLIQIRLTVVNTCIR
jgi:hypothetical protein